MNRIFFVLFLAIAIKLDFGSGESLVCHSYDDPHLILFDQQQLEFHKTGNHFILVADNQNNTVCFSFSFSLFSLNWSLKIFISLLKISAGFHTCSQVSEAISSNAKCNCAIYFRSMDSIVFVDFCGKRNEDPKSPASKIYGIKKSSSSMSSSSNLIDKLDSIVSMPLCPLINQADVNDESVWSEIEIFLDRFKCARITGGFNFDYYIVSVD